MTGVVAITAVAAIIITTRSKTANSVAVDSDSQYLATIMVIRALKDAVADVAPQLPAIAIIEEECC